MNRQFTVDAPNQTWVTDITYIRTHQGWLYLAVIVDLFSRQVIGWSMKENQTRDIVLDALMMAFWRRKPKSEVVIHSDQGSQYGSDDWHRFLRDHNMKASMRRRHSHLGQVSPVDYERKFLEDNKRLLKCG